MLKKRLLVLFCFVFSVVVFSQEEASVWYFGENAGLDFKSGTPVALTDGALVTQEGCSTISDFNGDLLFYTDGVTVWNRAHTPMPNGTGLLGDVSSTQSAIIVPHPGNADLYYLFTIDNAGEENGLQYNVVDITADGGMGDITIKNIPLQVPVTEKLTAVSHANSTDIWVMAKAYGTDEFFAYLVTPTGLVTTPVISNTGIIRPIDLDNGRGTRGYMKISPNGEFLAFSSAVGTESLELFRFNANTGVVSDPLVLNTAVPPEFTDSRFTYTYGIEFSSDSSKLYFTITDWSSSLVTASAIYQVDISTYNLAAIVGSAVQLAPTQSSEIGALQLAIDGKIYVTQFENNYLGAINNPNLAGLAADYQLNAVSLGTGKSRLGLPPFIQSFFIVGLKAANFCLGDATEFSVNTSEPITSISWSFGDGNTSNVETPSHTYATPGTYSVSVMATTSSDTKTDTKEITIYETPMANTATTFEVCSTTPTHAFNLATKDSEVLGTQLPSDYMVKYYSSFSDADSGTNALPSSYTNTLATETIYARISNTENASCYAITSFDIVVKAAPVLHPVVDWVFCDTDADGFNTFDLSTKNSEVLNGQSATTFSINYFETQADADANTNSNGPMYTNISSPQEIFFRIENDLSPECFETGSFNLEVITNVTAVAPIPMQVCDDDNDGFSIFNLESQNTEILGGQSATNFKVSYHASQADADNSLNPLGAASYANTIAYAEILYARVENTANTNCYNTTSFQVLVYDSPILQSVSNWKICDDDFDGIHTFDLTEKNTDVLGNQPPADFSISYHLTQTDATHKQNAITGIFQNTTPYVQTIFYRVENNANTNCFVTDSFALEVFDTPIANTISTIIVCDTNETGIQTTNFIEKDAETLNGQDATRYSVSYHHTQTEATANENPLPKQGYTNTNLQETIYARIQNNQFEACYAITSFDFIINELPQPNLEELYVICPDNPQLEIDGGDFDSWSWQDENNIEIYTDRVLPVLTIGTYSLTVSQTSNGVVCEKPVAFEVVSSGAPETMQINTSGFSDRIKIIVNAEGIGDFEYSVDGENFQLSNEFEVFPGEYTVYVRDLFLCRTITDAVFVLGYQKFFTPNGDGINEYWKVIGAEQYPESMVYIYDRYGKLIEQILPTSHGWSGTYNGSPVPASDYWFKYVYDSGKVFTGHFSLKR